MVDLFDIPVYYISFKKEKNLEKNFSQRGFKKVNHFQAVDGRKFTPEYLIEENLITIRSYHDLLFGRDQDSGLPSLGAVGCTMSHNEIWKLCVDQDLPYIAVAEADLYLNEISPDTEEKIKQILEEPNSLFMSEKISKKGITTFFQRTHFYIISNSACKQLIKNAFPIDVQTDWYISHMDTIKKINLHGFPIGSQKLHFSSAQSLCIKCRLPKSYWSYLILFIILVIIITYLWCSSKHVKKN
jgi:GR25 family glycosyltransferase involved in LPS biosynthesis